MPDRMLSEQEVLAHVLEFARQHEKVRAVWMNGSRVNPHVTQDRFCDYDVVFAAPDPHHFLADQSWIAYFTARFGDLLILTLKTKLWSTDSKPHPCPSPLRFAGGEGRTNPHFSPLHFFMERGQG